MTARHDRRLLRRASMAFASPLGFWFHGSELAGQSYISGSPLQNDN